MNPQRFLTQTIERSAAAEPVPRILAAAIQAVDPAAAVARHLHRDGSLLTIGSHTYDLHNIHRVLVIGFGKASIPMAEAAAQILGSHLTQGIIITKANQSPNLQSPISNYQFTILPASHPIPDQRGVEASQRIIALLETTTSDDLVLCLISGGGSALLTDPVAGISLADLQSLTSALLACGAAIDEINTLRKHLSRVKGGQLARWIAPARSATLILSDVVGDPLDVIASGPTVPDSATYAGALAVLDKYNITAQISTAIVTHLQHGENGKIPETPKPGDPIFERAQNIIIGNNLQAAQAAIEQAKADGFNTLLLTTSLQGEARAAGEMLAAIARQIAATGDPIPRPACVVAGGETTVVLTQQTTQAAQTSEVSGDLGSLDCLGGRNQELALAAVTDLAGLPGVMLITLATDGDDGPTDAAGAVVTGETLARARKLGLDPTKYLARHDSYHFFEPLGDLLKPGPTQTNVCDLTFIFAF